MTRTSPSLFALARTAVLGAAVLGAAAIPAGGDVLFEDDFDADSTANWTVNPGPGDHFADFFFDYSAVAIPPAPNSAGTTRGLKMSANLVSGVFTGFSVSPTGQSFEGNYELRFDMWINFTGPAPQGAIGSTQLTGAGVRTGGVTAQWAGGEHDSVWFGVTGDGGSAVDYRAVSPDNQVPYSAESGVYAAGTDADARNASHPYYAGLGGASPPPAQTALYPQQTGAAGPGAPAFAWRDVRIVRIGNTMTWSIDGLAIATVDAGTLTLGGDNILLLYSDTNASSSTDPDAGDLLFGLFDNVRVTALPDASIDGVLEFLDESVTDGTLTGSGPGGSAAGRLGALQNKLEAALALIEAGDIVGACTELNGAYLRTDGAHPPPDFVEGVAAEELAALIQALMDDLGCP